MRLFSRATVRAGAAWRRRRLAVAGGWWLQVRWGGLLAVMSTLGWCLLCHELCAGPGRCGKLGRGLVSRRVRVRCLARSSLEAVGAAEMGSGQAWDRRGAACEFVNPACCSMTAAAAQPLPSSAPPLPLPALIPIPTPLAPGHHPALSPPPTRIRCARAVNHTTPLSSHSPPRPRRPARACIAPMRRLGTRAGAQPPLPAALHHALGGCSPPARARPSRRAWARPQPRERI